MISSLLASTPLSDSWQVWADSWHARTQCAAYDWSVWLIAQGGDAAAPDGGNPVGDEAATDVNPVFLFLSNPINLILISAILFMFIVVRPQQKQMKEKQKALADLKKNDRVVTNAGIHGVVVQASSGENVVTIRIDENSGARMTVNRDTINILNPETKE